MYYINYLQVPNMVLTHHNTQTQNKYCQIMHIGNSLRGALYTQQKQQSQTGACMVSGDPVWLNAPIVQV